MRCTLCGEKTLLLSESNNRVYYQCTICEGILLSPSYFLSHKEEKQRYDLHNNDVQDLRYQKFVSPIVHRVLSEYNTGHKGLDFGSGSGPVITKMLSEKGYDVVTYDPFFAPDRKNLKATYDYIVCCEVMEHFYNPSKEFKLLHSLLNPGGALYCKTSLFSKAIDFNSWWYKNDPTHVFFYDKKTLYWIKEKYNFKTLEITNDLIVFGK